MIPIPRVVVDVQHAWRPTHPGDRGALFKTAAGLTVSEVDLALGYAAGLVRTLREGGCDVLTNDPARAVLVGPYSRRAVQASAWLLRGRTATAAWSSPALYLACHVNAGGGRYCRVSFADPGEHAEREWDRRHLASSLVTEAVCRAYPWLRPGAPVALGRLARGWACVGMVPAPFLSLLLEPYFGDRPEELIRLDEPAELDALGTAIARGALAWLSGAGKASTVGSGTTNG